MIKSKLPSATLVQCFSLGAPTFHAWPIIHHAADNIEKKTLYPHALVTYAQKTSSTSFYKRNISSMHRFRRVCPMRWSRLCPCSMRIRIAPFPIIVVGTVDLSTYKAGCMYDRKMWACTDVSYTHAYVYGRLYKRMHSHNYGSIVKVSVLFRSASFI